ncbi:GNAT family N-acetyltransferase [Paenibacillus polygoni]|uniref:GNAT family N-acetyltransferase n=1 Tax=Paenibacillus polygoni TaxID=3050112 RepID=A0ABY8X6J6_9BACL|nr:GNAT family N-acetyltransferase [Paenibacillus polygoni]WIV21167.1 GNAT family N-acetyltransferase [Paenibacillus polygoni]
MIIRKSKFAVKGLRYNIRTAIHGDSSYLSEVRLQIDGETENMDRERGEAFLDKSGLEDIIKLDSEHSKALFLVVEVKDRIVGFSRCVGNDLKRTKHRVEFGVCILKNYWGYGMGKNLLKETIFWADSIGIKKIELNVLETNESAIELYKSFGFEIEGVLKYDKLLSDGKYYNTIVMGRINQHVL